ncbi:putative zinc-finger [Hyphodiscus hymeniophilus]|uniref:Zinc-finger n=1 Tax=Hyphodiscus hymeniophilus TaxID=353542 RepID=A0A9P6SKX6_9HELO|nr:putative zinc-finger [Hyphodiscus hymeniophilus]
MSIQSNEEEGVEANANTNGTLYVPDGVYAPDTPGSTTNSPATLSAQSASASVQPEPTESLPTTNNSKSIKLCDVCHEKEYKYKCSRCELPYCSIACSTIHKATHPLPPSPVLKPVNVDPAKPPTTSARPGTVAASTQPSPFSALSTSTELHTLFTHYPNLSAQLNAIWDAMQPPASQSPDLYHKLTGKNNNPKAWNQDRGMEKGIEALRTARGLWGKDGEGVREFGELVLRIVEGLDQEEIVRRELERENLRVVKALMDGEL